MTSAIALSTNTADVGRLAAHLRLCDTAFEPPLSERVDIEAYAIKIAEHADLFEAWAGDELIGVVAAYPGLEPMAPTFITNVSVLPTWQGQGIASRLIDRCIAEAGNHCIELEVHGANVAAMALYRAKGFTVKRKLDETIILNLELEKAQQMATNRDYNAEIKDTADHKYNYGFDFDVMHPYMIRSFEPFFREGSLLELGSFKGDFTRRLVEHFDDVTCVEASDEALREAKAKLGTKAQFVNSMFETAELPRRYDNILLTHVLEHIDDPVAVLRRVNEEWLADGGRFFLVCPNANAPSRQIAVKMGLISHNAAVTPAEEAHGHRCTYSLDTLERDAVAAGLRVVHRSGIFFKALANFQWDRLLQTDIISKEYLEGCYQLGQQYPDLCSSIFLMCEAGPKK